MANNISITLIVPVFNGENYIDSFMKSLDSQTLKNFEVIFIDDGSKDESLNILKRYKRSNVFVYHQKNMGVSDARNLGISKSHGDIIIFPDIDDNLKDNYVERLVDCLRLDTQLGFCGYVEKSGKGSVIFSFNPKVTLYKNKLAFVDELLRHHSIGSALWNKVFLGQIIRDNNIMFDSSITIGEDLLFIMNYLKYVKQVRGVVGQLYEYTLNIDGAMNKSTLARKYNKNWDSEWCAVKQAEKIQLDMGNCVSKEMRLKKVRVSSKLLYFAKKLNYEMPKDQKKEMEETVKKNFLSFFLCGSDKLRMKLRVFKRIVLSL